MVDVQEESFELLGEKIRKAALAAGPDRQEMFWSGIAGALFGVAEYYKLNCATKMALDSTIQDMGLEGDNQGDKKKGGEA